MDAATMASSLGRFVKQRRDELGLTQTQLEQISGVPQRTISRIESTTKEGYLPEPSTLRSLAKGLWLTPKDLLAAAGYDVYDNDTPLELRDHRVRLFASKLDAFSEEELDVLMAWIRSKESDSQGK